MQIGTTKNGKAFQLPSDAVTQTISILGKRGVGKTHTACVITEQLLRAESVVVVIDPLDVWWGLRADPQGKPNGFPIVVLGGEHGDLPLNAKSGAAVADFVVERRASVVLSNRHFSMNEQRAFVTAFCEQFYHRKGEPQFREPVHLVIDEADEFAPQKIPHGHERMLGAVDRIVRRGRSSGIGVTLVTQRSAAIHKDVLSQTEMLVCHKTISPQDRNALEAWIEAHDVHEQRKAFMDSLASLGRGVAWFWSPGWAECFELVQVNGRTTFDSSATPKAGQKPKSAKLAPVDLDALRTAMAATVEEAEKNDPKKLRAEVERLKKELAAKPVEVTKPERFEIPIVLADDIEAMKYFLHAVQTPAVNLQTVVEKLENAIAGATRVNSAAKTFVEVMERTAVKKPARFIPKTIPSGPGEKLAKVERSILTVLAQLGPSSKNKIAVRARYAVGGGGFGNGLSACRTKGFIEDDGDKLAITSAGAAALGEYETLPSGRELLDYWLKECGKAEREILETLADSYPHALTKEQIAERTPSNYEPKGGSFNNAISRLRTLELIEGRGQLKAADELFN